MPRRRPPYPQEYREQMVELVRAGRTPEELAREYEPSARTIRNWMTQAGVREAGEGATLSAAEREELRRLRREVVVLRQEKDILKKAAAWFARESVMPGESSSS